MGEGRSEPPHNYPNKGDLLRLVYIRYVRAYGGEGKAEKLCLSEQKSLPEVEEKTSLEVVGETALGYKGNRADV